MNVITSIDGLPIKNGGSFHGKLLVITSIDGLPIKNGDFPWQTVSHNQMVISNKPMNDIQLQE